MFAITGTICLEKKRNTKQINVTSCESALPVNKEGVITVLKSLHGLDLMANRLYKIIGPDIYFQLFHILFTIYLQLNLAIF